MKAFRAIFTKQVDLALCCNHEKCADWTGKFCGNSTNNVLICKQLQRAHIINNHHSTKSSTKTSILNNALTKKPQYLHSDSSPAVTKIYR